jgi:hypothetical protein
MEYGPDPLITMPAGGLSNGRNERPYREPHSITRALEGKNLLALRAATTEPLQRQDLPPVDNLHRRDG